MGNKAIDKDYLLEQLKNFNEKILEEKYVQEKNVKDTFSATDENPISGKGVDAAIKTLDVTGTTSFGKGKTISTWSETDGKVAITSQDIEITKSQISDFPSSLPASDVTDTYSSTGKVPVSGTAVASAINALDVSSVGGTNKYISAISETDGKISATAGTIDTSVTKDSSNLITSGAVYKAIDDLPEPMIFKGSLGTGGTITSLPAAAAANEGFTYKVITAGTYQNIAAKVGDTFISNGTAWTLIPSGDEPSGTVTSVGVSVPTGMSVSGTPVTSSGTIAISMASGYSIPTTAKQTTWDGKYSKPSGGIPKGDLSSDIQANLDNTYARDERVAMWSYDWEAEMALPVVYDDTTVKNVVNGLAARTENFAENFEKFRSELGNKYSKPSGGIPKTDLASAVQTSLGKADSALQSYTEKYTGTVTQVKVGSTAYNPASGIVSLPAYPTSLPANGGNAATVNNLTVQTAVPANAKFTDTTYESKAAASGGTAVSLVTTGEKYTWNSKQDAITSSNKLAYSLISGTPTIPTIWTGTQAQYDAIATKDPNTLYLIQ